MNYIDGIPPIEASVHPWDEAYLIMVDDHFDMFLDLVGRNFIEYFLIDIHKGNSSKVLFVGSLYGLGIRVIVIS